MNESNNECIEILKKKLETLKEEKEGVDGKLAGLLTALKDLDNLIKSQRPSPTVESTSGDDQNKNTSVSETVDKENHWGTPIDKENPWGKDKTRKDVTPKECHLHAVQRIFRYLKSHPKLGLWYPKESPFDLVAYSDSDYDGATQDRKSTTEGCQFLGRRLSMRCEALSREFLTSILR
nr:putative ribonuclease H-like domain-containing protein [Tanacetum cinerariifolium]